MDIPNLEVVTLSGKRLSLREDLQEAVRFLEEDGCLVLKGATDLSPLESILSTNQGSLESVRKNIVLNDVSKVSIPGYLLKDIVRRSKHFYSPLAMTTFALHPTKYTSSTQRWGEQVVMGNGRRWQRTPVLWAPVVHTWEATRLSHGASKSTRGLAVSPRERQLTWKPTAMTCTCPQLMSASFSNCHLVSFVVTG